MIKYNIDKSELIVADSPQFGVIMLVQGWVYSDAVPSVDIRVETDAPYKITMYDREDVDKLFGEHKRSGYSGFAIEVGLYKKASEITCTFIEGSDGKNNVSVKLAVNGKKRLASGVKLYTKEIKNKKLTELIATRRHVKKNMFALGGNINGEVHYNIDEILYINACKEVIVRGWEVSLRGKNKLYFESGDIASEAVFKRPDVEELFKIESGGGNNGFEYRIRIKDVNEIVLNITNDEVGRVKINIPIDSVDGSCCDAKSVLSGRRVKEYTKKYGGHGIEFKKREREIYYQESIMNSKPYAGKREKESYYAPCRCDISIAVAVNSEIYLNKMNAFFNRLRADNLQVIYAGTGELLSKLGAADYEAVKAPCTENDKEKLQMEAYRHADREFVMFLDQEDYFDDDYLYYLTDEFKNGHDYIYSDYDLVYNDSGIVKVNRIRDFLEKENCKLALTACAFRKSCVGDVKSSKDIIAELRKNTKYYHNSTVMYHYSAVTDSWKQEPTKAIAFYLTQYHITEENNKWWGEGFTEWKNVKRAYPMFDKHDQPRVPTDLGYYDLVEDKSVQYKQIELAKRFGIYGFCYYYYWFEGKRLLRKPLDQFVENHALDLPYCICWANETWSKRWDGLEHEILMQQVHNEQTDRDFIYDIIPMLKDERYIRIDGRPVLLVYRFELFPYPNRTIELWREICRKQGVGEIHIAIVQAFDAVDHRIYGADSSVEFPPHKINTIPDICINDKLLNNDSEFKGNIYSYKRIVENMSTVEKREYELFPGSMLKWDNTARKMNMSHVFFEFSPELYRRWLIKNNHYTRLYNKDKIMFINAWNEWAEGSYLEPDETYGTEMLQITNEVVKYK